jgi:hypothetical protein
MDSIRIHSGIQRIAINDDPERVIEFNPNDVTFVERFYNLIHEFEGKEEEFQRRARLIDERQEQLDTHGIPENLPEGAQLLREVCEFMRTKIDHVFGPGTSQKAFGDSLSLDMIGQFFEGIAPFVTRARAEKLETYKPARNRKKRLMK